MPDTTHSSSGVIGAHRIVLAGALLAVLLITPRAPAAPPVFPADNPWNQQITNAPVAPTSAAIMNSITTTYSNGRLHPDFGQDYLNNTTLYGIPYNLVHGNAVPHISVIINAYANQSDVIAAPFPAGGTVVIEGDLQNAPLVGLANRGDSHLLLWDIDNNIAYEFYRCSRPSENADGQWHADSEAVWNFNTNTFRTLGWTSADAAGLPILPGLVRPDEGLPVAQGGGGGLGVIRHAIRFTLQNAVILNQYIYPASHVANPGNTNPAIQPPMGSRFRLKASVDISTLLPQSRIIAQAMKDYGLILADNGSNFFFSGASFSPDANNTNALTWNDNDIQDTIHGLKSLHYADFEVVTLLPIVTALSVPQAPAGSTVTITGQNFSGAAGQLQVLFGATPSASITITDDAHITASVPPGSGTVDVRIRSGITTAANSQNYLNTIFGYGLSATSAADRFTYGAPASGICCRGATCAILSQPACTTTGAAAGASFSPGATCNAVAVATTPCCFADYNKAGAISVQDIFDYLTDWFALRPFARLGGDGLSGTPGVPDIFNFLAAWFSGC